VPFRSTIENNSSLVTDQQRATACVCFLSIEWKLSGQFKLKEIVRFSDEKLFLSREFKRFTMFAIEVFSRKVYIDENTLEWNPTEHGTIFSNSSEESHRKIVGVQCTDGRRLLLLS